MTFTEEKKKLTLSGDEIQEKIEKKIIKLKKNNPEIDEKKIRKILQTVYKIENYSESLKSGVLIENEGESFIVLKDKSSNDDVNKKMRIFQSDQIIGTGDHGKAYTAHDLLKRLPGELVIKKSSCRRGEQFLVDEQPFYEKINALFPNTPYIAKMHKFCYLQTGAAAIIMNKEEGTVRSLLLKKEWENSDINDKSKTLLDLFEGLIVLRNAGIAHLDIKSDNVLFYKKEDGSIGLKFCDFGVSKFYGDTSPGMIGSFVHVCPESYWGEKEKIDLYCASALAFFALTGIYPRDGNYSEELAKLPKEYQEFFQKTLVDAPSQSISVEEARDLWRNLINPSC